MIIQKEKAEETKRNEASGALYNLLLSYVNKIKQTSILERCLLKAFAFAKDLPLDQIFRKQKVKGNGRPSVIMKLFDKAERALETIYQDKATFDSVKLNEYKQRSMIITIYLKFYISVFYANEKQYEDCYSIISRILEEVQRCSDFADKNNISKDSKVYGELLQLKKFAETDINYVICKTKATLIFNHQNKIESMNKDFSNLELKEGQTPAVENTLDIVHWLYDPFGNLKSDSSTTSKVEFKDYNLNILETGGKNVVFVDKNDDTDYDQLLHKKVRVNKKSKLVDLFPTFKPVTPKPNFYDIAGEAIEFPNLDNMIQELTPKDTPAASTGLFSKLKGAFFG